MIRLHSAVDLASSLTENKTLQYLDLSCNSLGRDGGEILGKENSLNSEGYSRTNFCLEIYMLFFIENCHALFSSYL